MEGILSILLNVKGRASIFPSILISVESHAPVKVTMTDPISDDLVLGNDEDIVGSPGSPEGQQERGCEKNKTKNSLRANYRKGLKKIAASKRSGRSADEVYTPSSWVCCALSFLERFEKTVQQLTTAPAVEREFEQEEDGTQSRNRRASLRLVGTRIDGCIVITDIINVIIQALYKLFLSIDVGMRNMMVLSIVTDNQQCTTKYLVSENMPRKYQSVALKSMNKKYTPEYLKQAIDEANDETFEELLQTLRQFDNAQTSKNKRTKLNVTPGKSVEGTDLGELCVADSEPEPSGIQNRDSSNPVSREPAPRMSQKDAKIIPRIKFFG
uniref:Uncharacterized protein n=1 Tax=Timema cristinae TaxID=61476 RepID=A0A7R9H8U5_TIMCR|nr:unnamed protein product [Timema cristinae]